MPQPSTTPTTSCKAVFCHRTNRSGNLAGSNTTHDIPYPPPPMYFLPRTPPPLPTIEPPETANDGLAWRRGQHVVYERQLDLRAPSVRWPLTWPSAGITQEAAFVYFERA